jgi:hypothetical protein
LTGAHRIGSMPTVATPQERSRAALIGALSLHAQVDSKKHIQPAREAFEARFPRQVLEMAAARGETLTEKEVQRRAHLLLRAHMQRLAVASARSRTRKSGPATT